MTKATDYILGHGRLVWGNPSLVTDAVVTSMFLGTLGAEADFKPLGGTYSAVGRMTNIRVGGVPVKKLRYMRIRHKATGRAALGIPMKNGLVAVQFDNLSAMGILASGWHIYPRHHFKRRKPHAHD